MAHPRARGEGALILASLFIAFVIWLIAKQSDMDTAWLRDITVQLEDIPRTPNVVVETVPASVAVSVQYPSNLSNLIVDRNFRLPINVKTLLEADPTRWNAPNDVTSITIILKPANIKSLLPRTIQVIEVEPREVTLRAHLRAQWVAVKVATKGELPSSLSFTAPPQPDPDKLLVTGPDEALVKLAGAGASVSTEPVDLSALRGSGQVFPQALLPKGVILLLPKGLSNQRVTVNIALSERPVKQTIPEVPVELVTFSASLTPVFTPARVGVVVEGPASVIKTLSPRDFVFSPVRDLVEEAGQKSEAVLEGRLKNTVPDNVAQQVRIVEIKPSRITVEFVSADKQDKAVGK